MSANNKSIPDSKCFIQVQMEYAILEFYNHGKSTLNIVSNVNLNPEFPNSD